MLTIVLIFSPLTAFAADTSIDLQAITHGTSGTGYSYSFGILLLTGSGPFVITTNGNTVTDRAIAVSPGVTASVTLNNAKIDVSSIWDVCAFDMTGATVALTLTGTNTLKSGDNRAGLEVPSGAELTVTAQSTGTLTATGGTTSAGIGGGYQADCGNVAIYGGTVIAVGTHSEDSEYDGGGAGIGGGGHGSDLSGHGGNGGTIVINGGTVSATGGACAAGIGGGSAWDSGGNTGSVIIQSGTVTATGALGAAGIGGGWRGGGGAITIAGGDVTANGSGPEHPYYGECGGAGLGSGSYAVDSGNIVITGGTITANGGGNAAGIGHGFFYSGTASGSVRIEDGDITAVGGSAGAGIGGGMDNGDMLVTIHGGRIDATGGLGGAGIGGGFGGNGGTIVISGGEITATGAGGMHATRGDAYGSGIGAGTGAETGTITISGGEVKASGAFGGVGIGGRGGSIEISGGTVTAIGGDHYEYYSSGGAGIGGTGFYGGSNAISISGGMVYAQRGADAQHDIGYGTGGTGMTLSISGSAAVLLQSDSCIAPTTTTHTHEAFPSGTTEAYGIAVPPAWSSGFGAYLRLVTLSYDLNSGTGTVPPAVTRNYLSAITASDGSGITRDGYELSGWNTAADGSGTACALGGTYSIMGETTLYARWTAQPALTSSVGDAKIYTGGRITLTPNISGGTWEWDETFFSATFNSPATFTALKAGTSTITYTVEGVSTTYDVTIEEAELPSTGQSFGWVWALAGAAALAGAVTLAVRKRTAQGWY
jgi:LPXTG-motif cell wall-anchored protein